MFTYKILYNLPPVPICFCTQALAISETDNTNSTDMLDVTDHRLLNASVLPQYVGRTITVNGQKFQSAQGRRFRINEEFDSWVRHNICHDITDAGVCFTNGSRYHGVHTDQTRDFVLIYLLDSGGEQAETVFFQEKGYPVWREKTAPMTNVWINDYSTLIEIDRIRILERQWVLLNADILHGVEGLCGKRISFQVGTNHNFWGENNV